MKKLTVLIFLMLSSFGYSQTYLNGWAVEVAAISPRMFADTYNEGFDVGGSIALTRNFSPVNAFRLKASYLNFNSVPGLPKYANPPSTDAVSLGIDYLITFNPCSDFFKIYGGGGFSVIGYKVKNPQPGVSDRLSINELTLVVTVGVNLQLSKDLSSFLELGHHTLSTDKFDGVIGPHGGVFGGMLDSYASLNVGLAYHFTRGPEINYCELPKGISTEVDYNKIQKMINDAKVSCPPVPEIDYKKIEEMIKKNKGENTKPDVMDHEMVLVGINFDYRSSEIKPEYYAILDMNASHLLMHKKVIVEITGHTDSKGELEGNNPLSVRRAQSVKDYLVSKGVDASRLTVKGVADSSPVADNSTEKGRALNRRVEFRIIK